MGIHQRAGLGWVGVEVSNSAQRCAGGAEAALAASQRVYNYLTIKKKSQWVFVCVRLTFLNRISGNRECVCVFVCVRVTFLNRISGNRSCSNNRTSGSRKSKFYIGEEKERIPQNVDLVMKECSKRNFLEPYASKIFFQSKQEKKKHFKNLKIFKISKSQNFQKSQNLKNLKHFKISKI